jgi:hypothetical protein
MVFLASICTVVFKIYAGDVFLQSDVWEAACAMRDAFEAAAPEAFDLSPLHQLPGAVFHWTKEQEGEAQAAEAAANGFGSSNSSKASSSSDVMSSSSSSSLGGDQSNTSSGHDVGAGGDGEFVSQWAKAGWLVQNPIGTPTEREHYVLQQGGNVYRVLLIRTDCS